MNLTYYLPDTDKRIERLRSLVNKRSVAILLPGGSIVELESRIEELRDCDICYFGLNSFRDIETDILNRIGKQFSVIMNSADPVRLIDSVTHFLNRKNDNLLISEETSFTYERVIIPVDTRQVNNMLISEKTSFMSSKFDYITFFREYDEKLLFFQAVPYNPPWRIPNTDYPLHFPAQSSFSVLLSMAVIGQASKVFFFGGDGGRIENLDLYFKGETSPEAAIVHDAIWFNESMIEIMGRVYKLYGLEPVDIFNCSINSHLTPFPKISYNEAITRLKGGTVGNNQTA